MALIKLGALAQDVRGSLAGTTFSKGRGGAIVRQKVSPVQPGTPRQLTQRAYFTAASQAWRTLTAAQRNGWDNYAANHPFVNVFGDSTVLSGVAMFTSLGCLAQTGALALLTSAPPDVTPGPLPTTATIVAATSIVTVTFTSNPVIGDVYLVFATRGLSAGAKPGNSDYRLAGLIVGAAATLVYTVDADAFNSTLVSVAGQRVGVLTQSIGLNGVPQPVAGFSVLAS